MPRFRTTRVVELEIESNVDWCDLHLVKLLDLVSDVDNTRIYGEAFRLPGIKTISVRVETDQDNNVPK